MNIENLLQLHQARPPQDNVPKSRERRQVILQTVRDYIAAGSLVCPLSMDELRQHSEEIITSAGIDSKYQDFIAVLINNETWRKTLGGIPFNKRLLLLPKCLRNHEKCRAEFDNFGLICDHCGSCMIDEFKRQAEKIGYAVLVAEGSPIVMSLIESGKVEAVIGVSCLSVLERTFPYMEAGAVPGIAIPLLYEGCCNTTVDVDWVWDAIYQTSDEPAERLDLDSLRSDVQSWFTKESLINSLSTSGSSTENLAIDWLAAGGKRWRPFLAVCAYRALCDAEVYKLPQGLKKLALAVECFHKASLIHDDIEDNDFERYGRKTLHAIHGIAVAINVGDLLLGEGYRLISETGSNGSCCRKMLAAAATGHRDLCIGQGTELAWVNKPAVMSEKQVIEVFAKKTSPAFAVALKLGALFSGADDETISILDEYSLFLGIAYQIRDDIEDFSNVSASAGDASKSPSLLMAMAYSQLQGSEKKLLESVWLSAGSDADYDAASKIIARLQIIHSAQVLMESYKAEAIASLCRLKSSGLKSLLRRVIYKIFNDTKIMGCCDEHKTGSTDSGGEV